MKPSQRNTNFVRHMFHEGFRGAVMISYCDVCKLKDGKKVKEQDHGLASTVFKRLSYLEAV